MPKQFQLASVTSIGLIPKAIAPTPGRVLRILNHAWSHGFRIQLELPTMLGEGAMSIGMRSIEVNGGR